MEIAESELLPGDGYDDVLKPFRTIEDIHVMASSLGWASASPRERLAAPSIDEALALVALFRAASDAPQLAAETHVVFAGAQAMAMRLLDGAPWSKTDEARARAGSAIGRWSMSRPPSAPRGSRPPGRRSRAG